MRKLVRLIYYPPILVGIFTLFPLLFFYFDWPGTFGLAKQVGADLELYVYAFLCVASFYSSFVVFSKGLSFYYIRSIHGQQVPNSKQRKRLRFRLIACIFIFIILGATATVLPMLSIDLSQLQVAIVQNESNQDLRSGLLSSEVPGIIRMLNYLIPGAVVLLFGVISSHIGVAIRSKWFLLLFCVVLVTQMGRSTIWMDRNSLLMILVIAVPSILSRFRPTKKYLLMLAVGALIVIAPVLYVAKLQSTIRGGELLETISVFHYADLGMANASLAATTTSQFALGMESLFTPISVVPRGIGVDDIAFPISNRDWIHNNAANLLTYSLGDFGYFGFLSYLIWGAIAGRIFYKKINNPLSLTWNTAYLWLIYAIATIWTVPIFRGPDYWCGVICTILAAWMLDRTYHSHHKLGHASGNVVTLPV